MNYKLYTAVGIMRQRRGEKGMTYPYVEIGKNEYHLDIQEMLLWSVLNWRILSANEIKNIYEKKVSELGLGCHKTMEACQYHLIQRGLIAEGMGETAADALYDLLSNLYIVPISENIFLRIISFVKLTFKGFSFKTTKRILLRDKRSDGEKKIMYLANQAIFSTAEIIKCVEADKTQFANDEEILNTIYHDEHTTSENIAFSVKHSTACRLVLKDVANLYLRQQIIFGRA